MVDSFSDIPLCSAYVEGPIGITPCRNLGPFVVERVATSAITVCAPHLGSVLMQGADILWPPQIKWEGPGVKPRNSFTKDEEDHRSEEVKGEIFKRLP
jgi:hypothetical protein